MIFYVILLYFIRRKSCNGGEFENIVNLFLILLNWFIKIFLIFLIYIFFIVKLGVWKLK